MKSLRSPLFVGLWVAGTLACQPEEVPLTEDSAVAPTPQEIEVFQAEVDQAMAEIRSSLQELRARMEVQAPEAWNRLAQRTHEAQADVGADVLRLPHVGPEEADRIRRSTVDRLTDLEAELTRSHIASIPTPQEFISGVEERLLALASDLEEVRRFAEARPEVIPEDGAQGVDWFGTADFRGRVADLQREISEMSTRANRLEAAPERFSEVREAMADSMHELTREVRKLQYSTLWRYGAI